MLLSQPSRALFSVYLNLKLEFQLRWESSTDDCKFFFTRLISKDCLFSHGKKIKEVKFWKHCFGWVFGITFFWMNGCGTFKSEVNLKMQHWMSSLSSFFILILLASLADLFIFFNEAYISSIFWIFFCSLIKRVNNYIMLELSDEKIMDL